MVLETNTNPFEKRTKGIIQILEMKKETNRLACGPHFGSGIVQIT